MENPPDVYLAKCTASSIYAAIDRETRRKTLHKKYNLAGDPSSKGGINVHRALSFVTFRPSFGPLVLLNVRAEATRQDENLSYITLKRVNGLTYLVQSWFAILFIAITLGVAIYQIVVAHHEDGLAMLVMPLFAAGYLGMLELMASGTVSEYKKKIIRLFTDENFSLEKVEKS